MSPLCQGERRGRASEPRGEQQQRRQAPRAFAQVRGSPRTAGAAPAAVEALEVIGWKKAAGWYPKLRLVASSGALVGNRDCGLPGPGAPPVGAPPGATGVVGPSSPPAASNADMALVDDPPQAKRNGQPGSVTDQWSAPNTELQTSGRPRRAQIVLAARVVPRHAAPFCKRLKILLISAESTSGDDKISPTFSHVGGNAYRDRIIARCPCS